MKFVVTGALGHIGSHLIRALPQTFPDAEVVMIDNMMTQRFSSLFDLPTNGRYRFIEGDVSKVDLRPWLEGCDAAIQLAAITDAAGSFDHADRLEANNLAATTAVAEACIQTGAPMIFPSTTSVYGSQAAVVDEDCAPEDLQPQSPYAHTKLKEEALLADWSARRGLRSVACRFGTIYGASAGMRFHTAVNKFCWQASLGLPITVWSSAYDQRRPYLELNDCAAAVAMLIEKQIFDGRIYNVVTANHTVRDVVDTIRTFAPDLQVEFVDSRIMNQLSYEVLNTRLMEKGFSPRGRLQQGIADTMALLRQANVAGRS